ncbi:unnamed protein product [Notodromas monacha]|uniref:PPPDE domain-containing protein n=1 Tax=Notodromas monacha TaxID=399045 RepID=A0A7R9GDD3_9CRUS|nr:unnamed protein product [Notodromas monacha]CAG0917057.1 unnamed protein product [Notodromas monacha]
MALRPDDVHLVQLYIYDISKGMSKILSRALIGKQVDGIWHTGVVVYGREYFFGAHGISTCDPGGTILGEPNEIEILGETQIPQDVFQEFLTELESERFRGSKYHLLHHNCNTFSNELSEFLVGVSIPAHIIDLPQEILSTPIGATIVSLVERIGPVPTSFHPGCTVGASSSASPQVENTVSNVSLDSVAVRDTTVVTKDEEQQRVVSVVEGAASAGVVEESVDVAGKPKLETDNPW